MRGSAFRVARRMTNGWLGASIALGILTAGIGSSVVRAEGLRGTIDGRSVFETWASDLRDGVVRTGRDLVPTLVMRKSDLEAPDAPAEELDGTVTGSIRSALRGSHELAAARAAAEAADLRAGARVMSFLPTASLEVGQEDRPNATTGAFVPARDRTSSSSFDISVPIFTSGLLKHGWLEARLNAEAAALNVDATSRSVALNAALAHVDTALRIAVLSRMQDHYRALSKVAGVTSALFRAGEASRTDVAIANANLAAARSGLADARRMVEDARATLLARARGTSVPPLDTDLPTPALPEDIETAVSLSHRNDPATRSLDRLAEAKAHGALAERGRYGPQVGLYGSYRSDLYRSAAPVSDPEWKVGLKLTVPVLQPGAVASVQAARFDALEAGHQAHAAAIRRERTVRMLWNAHRAATEKVEATDDFAAQIRGTGEGTQAEYEAGFRPIGDVLEAQAKLLQARIDQEVARHESLAARLRLAASLGLLFADQKAG